MKKMIYCIYFQLIFLSIFTDFHLQEKFGYFGRSLLNFVIPVFFIGFSLMNKRIYINKFLKQMWLLFFYICLLGGITCLAWIITGHSGILYQENIFMKAAKNSIYWAEIVMYMTLIYMCMQKLTRNEIWKPFVITFYFLFIYLILELVTMPYAFHIGYSAGQYYERVRLTTTESSLTVPLIIVFGISSIIYYADVNKNKWKLYITCFIFMIFIVTSGSKSMYVIMVLYGFYYLLSYIKRLNRKKLQLILFVFLGVLIIGGIYGWRLITTMNLYRSSYGIRGLEILAGILHVIRYPLGVGGGIYLETYHQCKVDMYEYLCQYSWFGQYVGHDVQSLIYTESEKNMACIAGLPNQSLYWGISGTIYWVYSVYIFIKSNWKRIQIKHAIWYKFLLMGIGMLWIFFMPLSNHYMTWGILVILFTGANLERKE